jgi:hypothetical protein
LCDVPVVVQVVQSERHCDAVTWNAEPNSQEKR